MNLDNFKIEEWEICFEDDLVQLNKNENSKIFYSIEEAENSRYKIVNEEIIRLKKEVKKLEDIIGGYFYDL